MQELYAYIFGSPDHNRLKKELSKTLLFKDLTSRELDVVAQRNNIRTFKQGEHVFFQGDPGSALYVILRGTINIERHDPRRHITLAALGQGMFFGELAIVFEGVRSATAYVAEDSTLFCLFKHDLDRILKHHPRLGNKLLLNLSRILAERLRASNERK